MCALFRDGIHVYEAWLPQSVMCRLCRFFPDGWWGGGCVRLLLRCLFPCCTDAGRSSRYLMRAGVFGSVPRCCGSGFFRNCGSGLWCNLTSSACAECGDPLATVFLLCTFFPCRRRRVARRRGRGGGVRRYGRCSFSRMGFLSSPGMFVGGEEEFDEC